MLLQPALPACERLKLFATVILSLSLFIQSHPGQTFRFYSVLRYSLLSFKQLSLCGCLTDPLCMNLT